MKISTSYINRKTLIFIVIAVMCTLLLMPAVVAGSEHEYVSLSPLPGTEKVDTSEPGAYFSTLFTLFIAVISILAVIKLMLCGFQYMTSEAISSKENAKKCIWAVIFGLFLILLSYLILSTINENLTKLNFDKIKEKVEYAATIKDDDSGVGVVVSHQYCYQSADGSPAGSSDSESSCNAVRETEIAGLDSQIAQTQTFINLENSYTGKQCLVCTIGTSEPYCYQILDLITGTGVLSTPFPDKGSCDTAHDTASAAMLISLDKTLQNLKDSKNSISSCTLNPSC